jgi:hypothetical protein
MWQTPKLFDQETSTTPGGISSKPDPSGKQQTLESW